MNKNDQKDIEQRWEAQSQDIVNKNNPVIIEEQEKGTKVG